MSRKFQKSALHVAICGVFATTFTATGVAQEQTQSRSADDEAIETIEVRGIRNSIASAQELKRLADTVKDVITATDIGALPDKSVTEALQRVPGVTIERFAASDDPKHYADEGTGVLVRGLDRVRSEINGRDAFSANPNGGLSYEDFPAELLGAVEVVKNQTADLISGGIAGTVNLITRKPFDSDEQLFAYGLKANRGDYREETTPSFNALFSDNWDTNSGKFGVLVAGSRSEFRTRGDGFGLGNYHSRGPLPIASYDEWGTPQVTRVAGSFDGPCVPNAAPWSGCGDVVANQYTQEDADAFVPLYEGEAVEGQPDGETWYTPAAITLSTAENNRKREGLTASLQWESNDERTLVTLEHIHSNASLEWKERVFFNGERGFIPAVPNGIKWFDDAENGRPVTVDNNGYLTSGVGNLTTTDYNTLFSSRYNFNESKIDDTSINIRFNATDALTVYFDYQHIRSEQTISNYGIGAAIRGGADSITHAPFFLDLRGSTPSVEFLSETISNPPAVPENTHPVTSVYSALPQEEANDADADSYQLDIEYVLERGMFTKIQAGLYYSEKSLIVRNTEYEGWQALAARWDATEAFRTSPQVAPELFDRVDFADHYDGKTVMGPHTSFLFPSMEMTQNFNQTLREGCGKYWAEGRAFDQSGNCALPYEDMTDRVEGAFASRHISKNNTQRTEFYIRADFEADISENVYLSGNLGLRSVDYELKSTGAITLPTPDARGPVDGPVYQIMQSQYTQFFNLASGRADFDTSTHDYSTLLPSLNLNFGIYDDFVVRIGASKGLYYPNLLDSRNRMFVTLDYDTVLQDPTQARDDQTNPVVDLTNFEVTGNASNPNLDPEESTSFDLSGEWYFADTGAVTVGVFHKELEGIIRNRSFAASIDNIPVSAYGPNNTGSGTIRGYELSYTQFYDMLPGAWSGLGLQFNYTYIDQDGLEDPNDNPAVESRFADGTLLEPDGRNSFRQFMNLPLVGYSDQNFNIVGMYEYAGISARLAYTWRSEYLLALREATEFVPVYSEAQGLMDASIYYSLSDNLRVGFEVSNLLGEDTKTKYQQNQEGTLTNAFTFTTDRRYAISIRGTF
ncbi:TonB-dependent receptor [Alteromonas sediminis]|uniref:TonB-dependent receptor n=1 Tax=Alteromonas sediminis TaxID=2259342 RepID=A0A3N5XZ21_9ALTE|nr:TonB-dependent receptor [Alteromonas sediminis]RPJ66507.1 TonB-dependent receptor [Alteromonas sediminis]